MINTAIAAGTSSVAHQGPPVAVAAAGQSGATAPPELRPPRLVPPSESRIHFDPQKLHENLKLAIEQLNRQLADSGRTLGFKMDDVLNTPVVTVRSSKTGEVIRQIPSEAVIKVAHTFEELKGLLVDEST